jgi:hypothetical protein
MKMIPFGMKTGWWSFDLSKYRSHPKELSTYSLFSYEDLPPIPNALDDDFEWLLSQPIRERSFFKDIYYEQYRSDIDKLTNMIAQTNVKLPSSFMAFMKSEELHKRVRSCTDCGLQIADHVVEAQSSPNGYLFHFLSDSQWIGHWYLYADSCGNHFIATSLTPYGFAFDDEEKNKEKIDLEQEDIWFCAPNFNEFIYRFWLENEIWYGLAWDKRPLTLTEQEYVDKYANKAKQSRIATDVLHSHNRYEE